jgi:hypothetical protein
MASRNKVNIYLQFNSQISAGRASAKRGETPSNKGDKMIETDYDLLRSEVKTQLVEQEGKYDWQDRDTNVRIVEDIRKAIDALADGVVPSAQHIAEVAIATNENLSIRDFLMGVQLEKDIDYVGEYISLLGNVIVKEKAVPLATVFCGYLYQTEEIEEAKTMLLEVLKLDSEYALAKLLNRVFQANWPSESFKAMAEQLHSQVVNTIYAIETEEITDDK